MDITIISPVYPPELVLSAQTNAQIAAAALAQSESVTVITAFPNRPEGRLYPGYHRKVYRKSILSERHSIIRCFSTFSQNSYILSRFVENISFGITSSLALLFNKSPDVIYANTWPVFAQGLTCLVARLRHIPLILSIQDVYPESLATQGRISSSSLLYKIIHWLDRGISRFADKLIVISDRFAKIYTEDRRIPRGNIHTIPNWVDPENIELLPKNQYRLKNNIPTNTFVFGYGGNIGAAAGVEKVIQAFASISNKEIYLVIAGDGSCRKACQNLVQQLGLNNVIIHSPWLSDETSEVLATADVLILPTGGDQSLASVPSKILNYMLASRPILAIASTESDTAEVIQKAGCGWLTPPDNPEELENKMKEILKTPSDQLLRLGHSGREYALQYFAIEVCLPRVIDIIRTMRDDNG